MNRFLNALFNSAKIKSMNIGVIYNKNIDNSYEYAINFAKKIENSKVISIDDMKNDIDIAFVIGGDGSFLKAARYYSFYEIPILGFNLGRIGYLSQANCNDVDEVIKKINSKSYEIEKRLMLKTAQKVALNDIVVKGKNCARTSFLDLYVNDKLLCSYVADGLIVATPTGTTAYSLSAGGPIISPKLNCFLVIPICPHTLNTRPVVIPDNEKITIKAHEKEKLNVSLDGQVDIETDNEVTVEKNDFYAHLLVLDKQKDKFYDILKEKLHWAMPLKNKKC